MHSTNKVRRTKFNFAQKDKVFEAALKCTPLRLPTINSSRGADRTKPNLELLFFLMNAFIFISKLIYYCSKVWSNTIKENITSSWLSRSSKI